MTGSQKCLAAPLGMTLVSVSPAAWDAMERRKQRASSLVYDLLRWKEKWIPASRGGQVPDGAPRRQPVSIPTHLTAALGVAVAPDPGGGAAAPLPPSRGGGRGLPRRARRDAARDVPGGRHRLQHRLLLPDAGGDRSRRGGRAHARPPRHPDRHRARQDPRRRRCASAHMGITSSPMYVLPTLVGARADAPRPRAIATEPGAGVSSAQAIFSRPRRDRRPRRLPVRLRRAAPAHERAKALGDVRALHRARGRRRRTS